MKISTTHFANGYELSIEILPWDHCVIVEVRDIDGQVLTGRRGHRGQVLPNSWCPALEREVKAGRIQDIYSLEKFYSKMSRSSGLYPTSAA